MARKRSDRPKKVVRRKSRAPVIRPERWFWLIVGFFVMVLAAFVMVGWLRSLL